MKKLEAPLGFVDKKTYWDRRNKGYGGQIPAPGTPKFISDHRKMFRAMRKDELKNLKGDHEAKKRKDIPQAV